MKDAFVPGAKALVTGAKALVTGASGGLGREIVRVLIENGFFVAALYNRNPADLSDVDFKDGVANAANVGSAGCVGSRESEESRQREGSRQRFFSIKADVRVRAEVDAAVEAARGRFGGLDCVINAAGISRDGLLVKYSEADFDDVMAVNLRGCFYVIRAALPSMEKSDCAHIINVSSISGVTGKAGQCAYAASKGALIGLTLSLARELGPQGVRVNALLPGYMDTPMGRANPRAMHRAKEASALGVLSSVVEAAEMILFILRTRRVTGRIFTLDGRVGGI